MSKNKHPTRRSLLDDIGDDFESFLNKSDTESSETEAPKARSSRTQVPVLPINRVVRSFPTQRKPNIEDREANSDDDSDDRGINTKPYQGGIGRERDGKPGETSTRTVAKPKKAGMPWMDSDSEESSDRKSRASAWLKPKPTPSPAPEPPPELKKEQPEPPNVSEGKPSPARSTASEDSVLDNTLSDERASEGETSALQFLHEGEENATDSVEVDILKKQETISVSTEEAEPKKSEIGDGEEVISDSEVAPSEKSNSGYQDDSFADYSSLSVRDAIAQPDYAIQNNAIKDDEESAKKAEEERIIAQTSLPYAETNWLSASATRNKLEHDEITASLDEIDSALSLLDDMHLSEHGGASSEPEAVSEPSVQNRISEGTHGPEVMTPMAEESNEDEDEYSREFDSGSGALQNDDHSNNSSENKSLESAVESAAELSSGTDPGIDVTIPTSDPAEKKADETEIAPVVCDDLLPDIPKSKEIAPLNEQMVEARSIGEDGAKDVPQLNGVHEDHTEPITKFEDESTLYAHSQQPINLTQDRIPVVHEINDGKSRTQPSETFMSIAEHGQIRDGKATKRSTSTSPNRMGFIKVYSTPSGSRVIDKKSTATRAEGQKQTPPPKKSSIFDRLGIQPRASTSAAKQSTTQAQAKSSMSGPVSKRPSSAPTRNVLKDQRSTAMKESILRRSNEKLRTISASASTSTSPNRSPHHETSPVVYRSNPPPISHDPAFIQDLMNQSMFASLEPQSEAPPSAELENRVKELQRDLRIREAEIQSLQNDLAQEQTKIREFEVNSYSHIKSDEDLRSSLEKAHRELSFRDQEIESLRTELANHAEKLQQFVQRDPDVLRKQLLHPASSSPVPLINASEAAQLTREIQEQETLLKGYQTENEKLVLEMKTVQKKLADSEKRHLLKVQTMSRDTAILNAQLENLREKSSRPSNFATLEANEKLQAAVTNLKAEAALREETFREELQNATKEGRKEGEETARRSFAERERQFEEGIEAAKIETRVIREENDKMEERLQEKIQGMDQELGLLRLENLKLKTEHEAYTSASASKPKEKEPTNSIKRIQTLERHVEKLEAELRATSGNGSIRKTESLSSLISAVRPSIENETRIKQLTEENSQLRIDFENRLQRLMEEQGVVRRMWEMKVGELEEKIDRKTVYDQVEREDELLDSARNDRYGDIPMRTASPSSKYGSSVQTGSREMIKDLHEQLASLHSSHQEKVQQVEELSRALAAHQRETVQHAHSALDASHLAVECEKLKNLKSAAEKRALRFEKQIEEFEKQIDRLREKIDKLNKEKFKLVDMYEVQISELTSQLRKADTKNAEAEAAARSAPAHAEEIGSLRRQTEQLKAESADLKSRLKVSESARKSVHEQTVAILRQTQEESSRVALAHQEQALRLLREETQRAFDAEISSARTKLDRMEKECELWKARAHQAEANLISKEKLKEPGSGSDAGAIEIANLKRELDQEKQRSRTPTIDLIARLEDKVREVEARYMLRSREMGELVGKTDRERQAYERQVDAVVVRYSQLLSDKNKEVEMFRNEVQALMTAYASAVPQSPKGSDRRRDGYDR